MKIKELKEDIKSLKHKIKIAKDNNDFKALKELYPNLFNLENILNEHKSKMLAKEFDKFTGELESTWKNIKYHKYKFTHEQVPYPFYFEATSKEDAIKQFKKYLKNYLDENPEIAGDFKIQKVS